MCQDIGVALHDFVARDWPVILTLTTAAGRAGVVIVNKRHLFLSPPADSTLRFAVGYFQTPVFISVQSLIQQTFGGEVESGASAASAAGAINPVHQDLAVGVYIVVVQIGPDFAYAKIRGCRIVIDLGVVGAITFGIVKTPAAKSSSFQAGIHPVFNIGLYKALVMVNVTRCAIAIATVICTAFACPFVVVYNGTAIPGWIGKVSPVAGTYAVIYDDIGNAFNPPCAVKAAVAALSAVSVP